MYSQRFLCLQSLATHESTHMDKRSFQSYGCSVTFMWKVLLTSHMLTHIGEGLHKCDMCSLKFTHKATLITIATCARSRTCVSCARLLSVAKSHWTGTRSCMHVEWTYVTAMSWQDVCTEGALEQHLQCHATSKPHTCHLCPAEFIEEYHLNMHMHIHMSKQPYKCFMCEKSLCLVL